ncbi:type II toxin-antitoxin system PemK/MazF family toxin [Photorhabdus caribbeanensis]|uniref:type II toxin-antitoxin system PemK/MazF family toxin n=1 Tax=Photorhabdus caribbeanensis TaxID=1004165 RepID=UPI0030EE643E
MMTKRKKFPGRGEIWFVDHDPVTGRELKGKHYFIVITETILNKALGTAICCPITTGGSKPRSSGTTVVVDGRSTLSGEITGVVLCHQIRTLDLEGTKATYATDTEAELLDEIIGKVIDLIDPQED